MTHNGSIPRSWREAAAYTQTPLSSLRSAVKRGDVPAPVIGADGKTVWDLGALDALRVARAESTSDAAVRSAASTALSEKVMPSASAQATYVLPEWLLRATDARDNIRREEHTVDPSDDDDVEAREPFLGIPLGATRVASPSASWPHSAVASGTASGSCIAELERIVSELQRQLAAAHLAWRAERVARLSALEALSAAIAAGAAPELVNAVGAFSAHALNAMPDDPLACDHVAIGVARSAGAHAAMLLEQRVAWHRSAERRPASDIERARQTRRHRDRGRERW